MHQLPNTCCSLEKLEIQAFCISQELMFIENQIFSYFCDKYGRLQKLKYISVVDQISPNMQLPIISTKLADDKP